MGATSSGTTSTPSPVIDVDGDGHAAEVDCDDTDATVFFTWSLFLDADGDGIGTGTSVSICAGTTPPAGHALIDGDCDDSDATIRPGADEVPYDGIDQDCDTVDLDDVDGDGHAFPADCDDGDSGIHPSATDTGGDTIDDDCTGDPYDIDGDGDDDVLGGDCDDDDPSRSSLLAEVHDNGIDDDCDPATVDVPRDQDGDGFTEVDDCDDLEPLAAPDQPELPDDGIDNDCDGSDLVAAYGVGIYVDQDDPGCTTGTGSLASPVCSIADGITASGGSQPVFVAGGLDAADPYVEDASAADFTVYGGYEGITWTRVGRTHWEGDPLTATTLTITGSAHVDRFVLQLPPGSSTGTSLVRVDGEVWFTDGELVASGALEYVVGFNGYGLLNLHRSTIDLESTTLATGVILPEVDVVDSVVHVSAPQAFAVNSNGWAHVTRSTLLSDGGVFSDGLQAYDYAKLVDSDVVVQSTPAVAVAWGDLEIARSGIEVLGAYGNASPEVVDCSHTVVIDDVDVVVHPGLGEIIAVSAEDGVVHDLHIDVDNPGQWATGVDVDTLQMSASQVTLRGIGVVGVAASRGEIDRVRIDAVATSTAFGVDAHVSSLTNSLVEVTGPDWAIGVDDDAPHLVANTTVRVGPSTLAYGLAGAGSLALVSSIVELEGATNSGVPVSIQTAGLITHSNILRHDGDPELVESLGSTASSAAELDTCAWANPYATCYSGSDNWSIDPDYGASLQLGPTSPMLGAGIDPATVDLSPLGLTPVTWPEPPTDVDGDPRLYWDIGADERVR